MKKGVILFLCLVSTCLFGLEVKHCSIVDETKHQANQRLLKGVLEQELAGVDAKISAEEKARYLMTKISAIGQRLVERGFAVGAYGVPEIDKNSDISFNCFVLWEGERIPVTFFVYVWPGEGYATKFNPSEFYCTTIHSHPIACAFTVLEGTLNQRNFEHLYKKVVRMTFEESFQKFQGSIDDLGSPFIHQMYAKSAGQKPALSLHAYGLSTEEKVMRTFRETRESHTYSTTSSR